MKRIITGLLALSICLFLCSCSGRQTPEETESNDTQSLPETSEQSNLNEIVLETPLIVAEDETLKVELVRFYQEYRCWNENGYPAAADASTEGATLEKFVVFKFYNKCDQDLYIEMEGVYLGSDGAYCLSMESSAKKPAAGKNVTGHYLIQTGEKETLKSMEELYSLDGEFEVFYQGEDGVLRNRYELKFSIPNALPGASEGEASASQNPRAWKQFRDYLQQRGPVTVETEKTDSGYRRITIEATAGIIEISYEQEASNQYATAAAVARNHMRFDLPANVTTVDVQIDYWCSAVDTYGGSGIQTCNPTYSWDIQNYCSGNEITFNADYELVDKDGNSLKKEGTMMSVNVTQPFILITDVLSQTLEESGLGITMADLGFSNY